MVPQRATSGLGLLFVGRRYQVATVELSLLLLLLLLLVKPGGQDLARILLLLPLVEGGSFLPVGMIRGEVEELLGSFWLDSPYLMDKGVARGTILEHCDGLVVSRVEELGTIFGEVANVVTETLTLLLPAMA
jgi:hypothetical protein